jgi:hypothetical protein
MASREIEWKAYEEIVEIPHRGWIMKICRLKAPIL